MGGSRIMRAGGVVALLLTVAVTVATSFSSASPSAVTVAFGPVGPDSAPQGVPFQFRGTLTAQQDFSGTVEIWLQPAGQPSKRVHARDETASLTAGQSIDFTEALTPSEWFAPLGRYELVAVLGGTDIGPPFAFTVTRALTQVPVFKDVTASLGLTTSNPQHVCTQQVDGAAWADVNGDGRLDLFVTRGAEPAELFVNEGKRGFVDQAAARGVAGDGTLEYGAVFADYNNDGYPDLYVTREGTDILYRNDGTGHFTDVTAATGVGGGNLSHRSAAWGDYDNDGRLDLYVVTYGFCYGPAQPDQLFHQNPNGTFTDVSYLIQPDFSLTPGVEGRGFQAAWLDYNGDGRQDLYLANDHFLPGADGNRLFRNDGPAAGGGWRFTDVSASSGADLHINSMGIGVGDYDRDGRLDLAVSNAGPVALLHNNGNGTFTNTAQTLGAAVPELAPNYTFTSWGTIFGDFNLDGWEDLYLAGGYIEHARGPLAERNALLVNDRGRRFLDVRAASHADDPGWSRGVATVDYDHDGRLDLLSVDQAGSIHLYRNVTPRGKDHWLELRLQGTRSNRDGCGAFVTLTGLGRPLVREVFCGSVGLASGTDDVLHFGLGTARTAPTLTVRWPSGTRQVLRGVRGDRILTIVEPGR